MKFCYFRLRRFFFAALIIGPAVRAMTWYHPSLPKSTDFDSDEPDAWSPAPTPPPAGEAVELLLKRDVSVPSYYCGYFNGSSGKSEIFTCCGIFIGTRAPVGEVIRECYG